MVISATLGYDAEPAIWEIVNSPPLLALGLRAERGVPLWSDYALEVGDFESGLGMLRRADDGAMFEMSNWDRGNHHVSVQTNDVRGVVVALVRDLKPRGWGVASLNLPAGMKVSDTPEAVLLEWGDGAWLRVLTGERLSKALTLAHLLASTDEALVTSLQSADGFPVFQMRGSPAASAREVGDALSPFTVERWSAWLASRG